MAEMKKFIRKLKNNKIINLETQDLALIQADAVNNDNRLVTEIICLLSPRNPGLTKLTDAQKNAQVANLEKQIEKLCYETVLRPAGWKILPSMVSVIDIIVARSKISNIDEIELIYRTHHHPLSESVENALKILKPHLKPEKVPSYFNYNKRPFQVPSFFH